MSIIQYARRNSGSETALKVLSVNTDDLVLTNARILMSQVADTRHHSIKLSLFVDIINETSKVLMSALHESRTIGERNVWLRDVPDGVQIFYAHEREARVYLNKLNESKDWDAAFPETNRYVFKLKHLDRAAASIRNFMLLGVLPSEQLTETQKEFIDLALYRAEIDIVSTLDQEKVDLFQLATETIYEPVTNPS